MARGRRNSIWSGWALVFMLLISGVMILLQSSSTFAAADDVIKTSRDYRWGYSLGYGGIGIINTQSVKGSDSVIERSEGPLMVGVFVDRLLSDSFVVGLEHSRGVSMVPFASGAWLVGIAAKWYFLGPAPSMVASSSESTLLVKRYIPFAGIAGGVMRAEITRDATDLAPLVSGSGTYFGIRAGIDYPTAPGAGLRPELQFSTTEYTAAFSTSATPPKLTQFSLQCAWYYSF